MMGSTYLLRGLGHVLLGESSRLAEMNLLVGLSSTFPPSAHSERVLCPPHSCFWPLGNVSDFAAERIDSAVEFHTKFLLLCWRHCVAFYWPACYRLLEWRQGHDWLRWLFLFVNKNEHGSILTWKPGMIPGCSKVLCGTFRDGNALLLVIRESAFLKITQNVSDWMKWVYLFLDDQRLLDNCGFSCYADCT